MVEEPQTAKEALGRLRAAFGGVKKAADRLEEVAAGLARAAEENGGKVPDINEIARQVLSEGQVQQTGCWPENINGDDRELIRGHWSGTAVFTDAWDHRTDGQKLPEEELLPGEVSAVTFKVGCYTVRSAQRVYKVHEPGYSPELEIPAGKEEVDLVKKEVGADPAGVCCVARGGLLGLGKWRDTLRLTHEISARHDSEPSGRFIYICRAAQARNASWSEGIGSIYTVKESEAVPDEYSSLLVCNSFVGSSFSSNIWYKLAPTGRITRLSPGAYGLMPEDARFE